MKKAYLFIKTYFLSALLFVALGHVSKAQSFCEEEIFIEIVDVSTEPQFLDLDFVVYNFNDVGSMQFTINFDSNLLSIEDAIYQNDQMQGPLFNFNMENAIPFAFIDVSAGSISLPDNDVIFTLRFNKLGNGTSEVTIGDDPVIREVSFLRDNRVFVGCINGQGTTFDSNLAILEGTVTHDQSGNCTDSPNHDPLSFWKLKVSNDSVEKIVTTRRDGTYKTAVEPGTYKIEVLPLNDLWEACIPSITTTLSSPGDSHSQEFTVKSVASCTNLNVDISAAFLRRCFENTYKVRYSNEGTIAAEDVTIEVEVDPFFIVISSSEEMYSQDGNVLTFDIGDVDIFESGSFSIIGEISCESELGQTHCTTATVYPPNGCGDETYNGPILEVDGACEGDEVIFTVRNIGILPTTTTNEIIIAEDDVMLQRDDLDLAPNQEKTFTFPANGSTYRLTAQQDDTFPVSAMPTRAIEGCGINAQGTFSTGFVTMFSDDDGRSDTSMDCQENRGSFDPNDKQAFPRGYGDAHSIYATDALDYLIRFQNTGTDTAFKVVVIDTLSKFLDESTLTMGAVSHPYEVSIDGKIVRFEFSPIALVDSTTNEPASNGFINFSIEQKLDNPLGSIIENSAGIYFDFNEPIQTNTTFHKVDEDFLKRGTSPILQVQLQDVTLFPNPMVVGNMLTIHRENSSLLNVRFIDISGRYIKTVTMDNGQDQISIDFLGKGIYFLELVQENTIVGFEKLVINTTK